MGQIRITKKIDLDRKDLLSRQTYLITQSNDLAKAFGNLSVMEHKLLDYCFTMITKNDDTNKIFNFKVKNFLRNYGLNTSGASYKNVYKNFSKLGKDTTLCLPTELQDGSSGIRQVSLFFYIDFGEKGEIEFKFNPYIAPYIFRLKKFYYSFHLGDLTRVKSKYTLIFMKLWNSHAKGQWSDKNLKPKLPPATITGSLDEWKTWFLGVDSNGNPPNWTPSRFKSKVLKVAITEIDKLFPNILIDVDTLKEGRRVVGYTVTISSFNSTLTNIGTLWQ